MPSQSNPPPKTYLTVPQTQASERILKLIAEAESFLPTGARTRTLDELYDASNSWSDYTVEMLKTLFTANEPAQEFEYAAYLPINMRMSGAERFNHRVNQVKRQIEALKSIHRRLEFFNSPVAALTRGPSGHEISAGSHDGTRGVFIVHGHDDAPKQAVARFLEKLGLRPVILHEQVNSGRTVIQKFEDHASVDFAIVLLTADDEGRARGANEVAPRARQNVILELGYFIGKLGLRNVVALRVGNIENPSDFDGVLYISFDSAGAWRLSLGREMKAAGLDVDLNRIS